MRSLNNKEKIAHLQEMIDEGKPLELVEADLVKPESWECIKGCEFVAHTASPFFIGATDANAEEKLYKPAKEGTLNVLSKALDHGVKKSYLHRAQRQSWLDGQDQRKKRRILTSLKSNGRKQNQSCATITLAPKRLPRKQHGSL